MIIKTLKKRRHFLKAAQSKKRRVKPAFIVQLDEDWDSLADKVRPPDGQQIVHVGYTASRKVGGAVQRNRAKRRMRAMIRTVLPEFDLDRAVIVLIARRFMIGYNFQTALNDLREALEQMGLSRSEISHKKREDVADAS